MDRHRGGGGGDRYRSSSPDPHHHFNSSKYSRGSGPAGPLSPSSSEPHHHYYHHHHHRRASSPNNHDTPPAPMNNNNHHNYRGGDRDRDRDRDRDYRRSAFDSPPRHTQLPRYPLSPTAGGTGWSRLIGNVDRDHVSDDGGGFHSMSPLSGQKRGFSSFSEDIRGPPFPPPPAERYDGGSFAKLFVGSVPRTVTEEDIRPVFDKHGHVLEVALIRDKRTGQQQGCCFIKYATSQEADRAIRMLHNQYTLPGGVGPIQVRYADGERERLGTLEFKLFVGSLNKDATEKEVEEIFAPYGRVEDVHLMRDDMKQSRGCGFVKYSYRDMALAAINALNGKYTMRGCEHPLTVRFADPKRPRLGESRGGAPVLGGPGLGPHLPSAGVRPPMMHNEPMHDRFPPNALQPMSPQKPGLLSASGQHAFGNHFQPRPADVPVVSMPGNIISGSGSSTSSSLGGYAVSSTSTSQFNYGHSLPLVPSSGPQISPLQKPLQSPPRMSSSLQLQPPNGPSFVQPSVSHPLMRPVSRVPIPGSAGQSLNQALPSQQLPGLGRQLSASQPQVPLNGSSVLGQGSPMGNLHPHVMSAVANQQQMPAQQQLHQPPQQSPSQLAQMLSQQTQTLQASFQSSQQAFSQLQQQLQLMQPSNQSSISQQGPHPSKQQSPWPGTAPQTVGNASTVQPGGDVPAVLSASSATPMSSGVAPGKCNWTEHTSPDGYKYYYNSSTGESKWEKPEELAIYEQQQQQRPPVQYPQVQHFQSQSVQNVPQGQTQVQHQSQTQLQPQNRPQQLQQLPQSILGPGGTGHRVQEFRYTQLPVAAGSNTTNDMARYQQQQVQQPGQDWMWKNKPAGT